MTTTERAKRVGIWLRVSTEGQVKDESPETHEYRAREHAERKGWKVVEVYRLDAVSGKTVKEHPEAKRMLVDIQRGHISGLVFSKLARLARNTRELLEFHDHFRQHDAELLSLDGGDIDMSTSAGKMMYTFRAAQAEWERAEIAERVSASVSIRAKMGKPLGGAAPFGYQWKDKKLIADPAEAPVLKLMFELFAEVRRKKTVARLLNERGFRTRNGSAFSSTTVGRLLQDSTAKGVRRANYTKTASNKGAWTLKPASEWIYQECEAVVSEELWNACGTLLAGRKENRKPPTKRTVHLFSGLTYCHCGQKMYVPSDMHKYVCQKCRNKLAIDDLEAVFVAELTSFFLSTDELARLERSASDALKEKEQLAGVLDAERVKLAAESEKLYQLYLADAIDARGFGEKNGALAARLVQLDDEIPRAQADRDALRASLRSQEDTIASARDLYGQWDKMTPKQKRTLVESIVEKIIVGADDVSIQLFYDPPSGRSYDNTPESSTPSAEGGSVPPSLAPQTHTKRGTNPHSRVPFLRGVRITLKALKPKPFRGEPKTVGEHLKARRLSLGRYQKDVAPELGVDVFTLLNWEKGRTEPFAASYPAILAFLRYDPFPPPQTIGERLKAARRMNGWTIKEGAAALGVDEATFGDWERGKTILFRKHRERVATFLSIPADVIDEHMAARWGEAHKTVL